MEGLGLFFPSHCYFLYPKVQFSLRKNVSRPLEDIKVSSIFTAHVTSQLVTVHWKRTLVEVTEGHQLCSGLWAGAYVHVCTRHCVLLLLPKPALQVSQSHDQRIFRAGVTLGSPGPVTRTKWSLDVGQLFPNASPQASLSEPEASGFVSVTISVTFFPLYLVNT